MMGLDTNVLVRLFVDDDMVQATAARRFVAGRCSRESPGYVDRVVLCEMTWVLTRVHGYDRAEMVSVVEQLLASQDIVLEDEHSVRAALGIFATRGIEFADALICAVNRIRGCEATATFDRKAARLDGFVRVA